MSLIDADIPHVTHDAHIFETLNQTLCTSRVCYF